MPVIPLQDWIDSAFGAFGAFWAGRTPVAYPNLPFDPSSLVGDDAAWVRLFVLHDRGGLDPGGQLSVGPSAAERSVLRTGIWTTEVYVREASSALRAYTFANDALGWLQDQRVPQTVFSLLGVLEVGGAPWWQLNVSARFMYLSGRAA